jgi:hypothetical protein
MNISLTIPGVGVVVLDSSRVGGSWQVGRKPYQPEKCL